MTALFYLFISNSFVIARNSLWRTLILKRSYNSFNIWAQNSWEYLFRFQSSRSKDTKHDNLNVSVLEMHKQSSPEERAHIILLHLFPDNQIGLLKVSSFRSLSFSTLSHIDPAYSLTLSHICSIESNDIGTIMPFLANSSTL